jgi:AcrR family transcriptional regulator
MSIDCYLDVLAPSPKEINYIAAALLEPSREFLVRIIERDQEIDKEQRIDGIADELPAKPAEDAEIEGLREFLAFRPEPSRYVFYNKNKARRVRRNSPLNYPFKRLIDEHLCQVSGSFPTAIFLVEYREHIDGVASREVMRNAVVERWVSGNKQAPTFDWVLPDIFAPFLEEYEKGLPFGSMWSEWVADLAAAADGLRKQSGSVHGEKGLSPIPE